MFKKYLVIFILFLAVVMVVSGYKKSAFVINQSKNNTASENKNETATTTKENNASSSTDENLPVWPEQKYTQKDYDGWKTYSNEKLGYKIKYPANWTIKACDEGCASKEVIINPPDAEDFTSYISISLDGRNIESIRNVLADSNGSFRKIDPKYKPDIENKIIFSNKKSFQFLNQMVKNRRSIFVLYKDTTYMISAGKDQNPLVLQALASFEFID
jgi:hypothetical protein